MSILDQVPSVSGAVEGAVEGIGGAVSKVASTFVGDQGQRDQQAHEENTAVLSEFQSEFANAGTGWWASFITGLNRLPRPVMALGVIGLMVWCPIDPIGFASAMVAYAEVPLWLAGVLTTIVGFYFTFRHLEKRLEFRPATVAQVAQVARAITALKAVKTPPPPAKPWAMPPGEVVYDGPSSDPNSKIIRTTP